MADERGGSYRDHYAPGQVSANISASVTDRYGVSRYFTRDPITTLPLILLTRRMALEVKTDVREVKTGIGEVRTGVQEVATELQDMASEIREAHGEQSEDILERVNQAQRVYIAGIL